jgi:hypothetical protein
MQHDGSRLLGGSAGQGMVDGRVGVPPIDERYLLAVKYTSLHVFNARLTPTPCQ